MEPDVKSHFESLTTPILKQNYYPIDAKTTKKRLKTVAILSGTVCADKLKNEMGKIQNKNNPITGF